MYDDRAIALAEEVSQHAIADAKSLLGSEAAVAVKAPSGAGKSYLVGTTVGELRRERARVVVAAPTNDQVFGLVELLAVRHPKETITAVLASDRVLPPTAQRPNVV